MTAIEATGAGVSALAQRCPRHLIDHPANQVTQGVAAKGITTQQCHIHRQNDCADADAEAFLAGDRISKPQGLPNVVTEEANKQNCHVEEIAVHILQD